MNPTNELLGRVLLGAVIGFSGSEIVLRELGYGWNWLQRPAGFAIFLAATGVAFLIGMFLIFPAEMRTVWSMGLVEWYRWRVRGYVAAPRDAFGVRRGTSWQQHEYEPTNDDPCRSVIHARCGCGAVVTFDRYNYFVRAREHAASCTELDTCHCPVTDARFCLVCQKCGLGHWMDASPKGAR